MPKLIFTTELDVSQERVWEFHSTLDALEALTPPGTTVTLPEPRPTLGPGVKVLIVVRQPPVFIPLAWESVMEVWEPPLRFVDIQGARGPWKRWRHEHRFEALGKNKTRLIDTIDYTPPFGFIGAIADRIFLRKTIERSFLFRHARTKDLLRAPIDVKLDP